MCRFYLLNYCICRQCFIRSGLLKRNFSLQLLKYMNTFEKRLPVTLLSALWWCIFTTNLSLFCDKVFVSPWLFRHMVPSHFNLHFFGPRWLSFYFLLIPFLWLWRPCEYLPCYTIDETPRVQLVSSGHTYTLWYLSGYVVLFFASCCLYAETHPIDL